MQVKRNILFVSATCSERVFDFIFNTLKQRSGNAIQKFHNLILIGLAQDKSNLVETLTSIPVAPTNHDKKLWNIESDYSHQVKYNYVPALNLPYIKNIGVFVYSFFKMLFWKFPKNAAQNIIICDVLKLSLGLGVFIACKLRGIKQVAVITDMPGMDVFQKTLVSSVKAKLILLFLSNYDGYILITKHINQVINPKMRPHLIMEGSVDSSLEQANNDIEGKSKERILVYAGGIYERYGIKTLIEAFMKLKDEDLRLYIYGEGDMMNDMVDYMQKDSRILYLGVVANDIVVNTQMKATLLINPRPSVEEYTKYSFPSKNMEYMVSGTPVVTTSLPGMPEEYLPYVYLFKDESMDGIHNALLVLLNKTRRELHDFGINSKNFVLKNKNNLLQAKRISTFLSESFNSK